MVIALFDTNILIDYLNGEPKAKDAIEMHEQVAISIISYLEVMAGVETVYKQKTEDFLSNFQLLNFDINMSDEIVNIRKTLKIKLPDAIILATARKHSATLITSNIKDFSKDEANVLIPYYIGA